MACILIAFAMQNASFAYDYIGGASELNNAINSVGTSDSARNFFQNQSITLSSNLGSIVGANSVLTINGDSLNGHTITGASAYSGIGVSSGQTLNINTSSASTNILATFSSFKSSSQGGVISSAGITNVFNTSFSNNVSSTNGGAIYNTGHLNISNYSSFINNHTTNTQDGLGSGGAIYNTSTLNINNGVTFAGNYTSNPNYKHDYGGAIDNNGSSAIATIDGATFKWNGYNNYNAGTDSASTIPTYFYNGGAIANEAGASLIVSNSTFSHNGVLNSGAGICNFSSSTAQITNTTFTNNSANYGAAIWNDGSLSVSGASSFSGNTSKLGGAICNSGTVNINNTTFSGNAANNGADGNGGAIYNNTSGSNLNISNNSSFSNNTASGYGGAIMNTGTTTISQTSFSSNQSPHGGAIWSSNAVTILNSSFNSNTANGSDGGAIFSGGSLKIANTSFTNNTATSVGLGGAINNKAGGLTYIQADGAQTLFQGNKNLNTINNAIYQGGISGSTSSLYLNSGNSGNITSYDAITGSNTSYNNIYINSSDSTASKSFITPSNILTSGVVNLYANITGNTIYDYSGTTYFGANGSSNTGFYNGTIFNLSGGTQYFNNGITGSTINKTGGTQYFNSAITNSSLNIGGGTFNLNSGGSIANTSLNLISGTFNMANGVMDTISLTNLVANPSAILKFDADFQNGTNDKINVTSSASGTLSGVVNILSDKSTIGNSTLTMVTGSNISGLTLANIAPTYTTYYKYTFTGSNNGTYNVGMDWAHGLNSAVAVNTLANRSFSATADTSINANLGTMGMANSTLNIFGNGYSVNGAGYSGVTVNFGQTLNINPLGASSTTTFTNFNNSTGSGGVIYNSGTANIYDSVFVNNTANGNGGAIWNNGILNINTSNNGITTFSGNIDSTGRNDIYLNSGSTLNLNAGANGNITFNSGIISNGSTIDINNPVKNATLTSGNINLNAPITATAATNVNLYGGSLNLGADNYLDGTNLALYGGTLNMANGHIGTMALNTLNLNNVTNLGIDADLASSKADFITANFVTGTGTLNINNVRILSDATIKNSEIPIVDTKISPFTTFSEKSINGPLYKYNLTFNNSTGRVTFANTNNFSSNVLAPQASSVIGAYLNQVNVYSEALGRSDVFMSMPHNDRLLMRYQNKLAYAGEPIVLSPLFTPEDKGGLWVKEYTTFENIPLNNGPNVSNVGYGALIGGDTPLEHLKHGYDGFLTLYAGYNGSHQNYDNVGIYQNGGSLGVTGTLYKGNWFTALTGNVGTSNGNAQNNYGTDNFTTLSAGLAWKLGYNYELFRGKFIVQPSYVMSYTYANTFNYQTASGVNITSQPLNAIQIAPGVKFIANMKEGWQPYLLVNMVWNIMDGQKFYANDLQLPQMSVDPYVEYGVGLQRRWGERFTGFGQAVLRGGGRNGLALQFGFRWAIGKASNYRNNKR